MSVSTLKEQVESFRIRLNELIGDQSYRAFANKCSLSETAIRKYSVGESTPNLERLYAIAEASGVSLRWLTTGEGPMYQDGTGYFGEIDIPPNTYRYRKEESSTVKEDFHQDGNFKHEYALIPVYQVSVSAGNGSFVGEEHSDKHLAFRRRWLTMRGFDEQDLAVVMANGDSMEPTIPNKSTLVVHTGRKQPTDGNIYVIRNGDQVWVKRIQVKPGAWLLLSENKLYPPIEIPMTEQNQFEIVGQVVHISKDIGD
ncbi:helix-turn-helix domain-containing protein [Shewanella yunxiaonensis]|uniref:Helix-turn-helix domain-containing protein n=1 Tax=Shewanella yunxiaonensis TaxID=2829809 RepID=A0ABX7YUN0_9GAMM|nr:S24 family peptidase [Shewanella yunxiaonensis]QUN06463.1 helix-turn-helix domain-containing protein [Shewanella yunxiaonensis]